MNRLLFRTPVHFVPLILVVSAFSAEKYHSPGEVNQALKMKYLAALRIRYEAPLAVAGVGPVVLRFEGDCRDRFDYLVALAGNPNTGKSPVFNALTGLRQHTGNWPGKTVTCFSFGGLFRTEEARLERLKSATRTPTSFLEKYFEYMGRHFPQHHYRACR